MDSRRGLFHFFLGVGSIQEGGHFGIPQGCRLISPEYNKNCLFQVHRLHCYSYASWGRSNGWCNPRNAILAATYNANDVFKNRSNSNHVWNGFSTSHGVPHVFLSGQKRGRWGHSFREIKETAQNLTSSQIEKSQEVSTYKRVSLHTVLPLIIPDP